MIRARAAEQALLAGGTRACARRRRRCARRSSRSTTCARRVEYRREMAGVLLERAVAADAKRMAAAKSPMIFGPDVRRDARPVAAARRPARRSAAAARSTPLDPLNLFNLSLEGRRRGAVHGAAGGAHRRARRRSSVLSRPRFPTGSHKVGPGLLDPGGEAARRASCAPGAAHARLPLDRATSGSAAPGWARAWAIARWSCCPRR